jgi:hypothetical protein
MRDVDVCEGRVRYPLAWPMSTAGGPNNRYLPPTISALRNARPRIADVYGEAANLRLHFSTAISQSHEGNYLLF